MGNPESTCEEVPTATEDHAVMEAHLLAYLRHHGAVARGLAETFGFNLDELIGTLIEMGEKDWVEFGRPWGVTVVALTPLAAPPPTGVKANDGKICR